MGGRESPSRLSVRISLLSTLLVVGTSQLMIKIASQTFAFVGKFVDLSAGRSSGNEPSLLPGHEVSFDDREFYDELNPCIKVASYLMGYNVFISEYKYQ